MTAAHSHQVARHETGEQTQGRGIQMPEVSVVAPVFNAEATLTRMVDTVLHQSFERWELILVDDGSTDATPAHCDSLATSDPRVRVIHQENLGAAAARQRGLEVARGAYVTFVDADDLIDLSMIDQLVRALDNANATIAVCGHVEVRADGRTIVPPTPPQGVLNGEEALELLLRGHWLGLWGKLFCRSEFDSLRWPDLRVADDLVVNARLFGQANRVAVVHAPLYKYVESPDGLTRKPLSVEKFAWLEAVQLVCDQVAEFHPHFEKLAYAQAFTARFSLLHRALLERSCAYDTEIGSLIERLRSDRMLTSNNPHIPMAKRVAARVLAITPRRYPKIVRALSFVAVRFRKD